LRPIVLEVTRRLCELTGLDKDKINFFFPSESAKIAQAGSTISPIAGPQNNLLPFSEAMTIEVNEEYQEGRASSTAIRYPENRLVFFDDRLDTVIRPAFAMVDVTLNFRYRAPDRETAERWRGLIKSRLAEGEDQHIHRFSYNYRLPDEFWVILREIYRLREANAGYGETFEYWLTDNSTQRLGEVANLAGTQVQYAVAETQRDVPATFDFTMAPDKGDKEDGGEARTVSFTYKFSYDKPVTCNMSYPLVIHNEVIKYRDDKPINPNDNLFSYTSSMYDLAHFMPKVDTVNAGIAQGFAIPEWDEFYPIQQLPATMRLMTAMCTIDPADPSFMLNVGDLGDIALDDKVLAFLLAEAPYATTYYRSVFALSLFENRVLQGTNALTMDTQGNVRTVDPNPSLRSYWHVRLGLVTDLRLLDQDAIDRARDHGTALIQILKVIDPTLESKGLLPTPIGDDYITRSDLNNAINEINRGIRDGTADARRMFALVQTLFIQTGKLNANR
jgi:hypothetical protein